MAKERRKAVPITEGRMSKGGLNEPLPNEYERPPAPQGSGGKQLRSRRHCRVTCMFDELKLEIGDEVFDLTADQADELAEILQNGANHCRKYEAPESPQ